MILSIVAIVLFCALVILACLEKENIICVRDDSADFNLLNFLEMLFIFSSLACVGIVTVVNVNYRPDADKKTEIEEMLKNNPEEEDIKEQAEDYNEMLRLLDNYWISFSNIDDDYYIDINLILKEANERKE